METVKLLNYSYFVDKSQTPPSSCYTACQYVSGLFKPVNINVQSIFASTAHIAVSPRASKV